MKKLSILILSIIAVILHFIPRKAAVIPNKAPAKMPPHYWQNGATPFGAVGGCYFSPLPRVPEDEIRYCPNCGTEMDGNYCWLCYYEDNE